MVTGHIRKRPTKGGKPSYQIVLETGKDPITDKRQRMHKTVNGTKKEAETMMNNMRYQLQNGNSITKPSPLKLRDWMNKWYKLYTAHLAQTTRAGYKQQIDYRINPPLGNIALKDLNPNDIQAWVNWLSNDENLTGQTVKNIFLNLQSALEVARK